MPIQIKFIVGSRLVNVYLLGALYAAAVYIPSLIANWIVTGLTFSKFVCGIVLFILITAFVMILSCLLGWCVAKISLRLKNKTFVTVAVSLAFIILYYIGYAKISEWIKDLVINAAIYGEKIKGVAYGLYLLGDIGTGNWIGTLIFTFIIGVLAVLTWLLLKKTFLAIAISSSSSEVKKNVAKSEKTKTVFGTLIHKELRKITSSAVYLLNCGLGIFLMPAAGIVLLIKGRDLLAVFGELPNVNNYLPVMACAILIMLAGTIDTAAPSVSLEGKNIWILQSLPLKGSSVLLAKASVQMILSSVPLLVTFICICFVLQVTWYIAITMACLLCVFVVFSAFFATFLNVSMPNLIWTNEIVPIKQGGAVAISLFGMWGVALVFGGLYFLAAKVMGALTYLLIWVVLFVVFDVILYRWLTTVGSKKFAEL